MLKWNVKKTFMNYVLHFSEMQMKRADYGTDYISQNTPHQDIFLEQLLDFKDTSKIF